ncbi:hypothetical protein [Cryptosporangium minutisporangium]|uniref:DUF5666 domain-containing protein n=1 Tax=Cryptosporangium minutisporangium TaxID=113569 RepID=A0ABP6TBV7_9ACTN
MPSDHLFAAASVGNHPSSVAEVPVVRDRRRRGQQVELVGTIHTIDVVENTVTIVDSQDGRRVHPELTVRLTAHATITVDGKRRVLSSLPVGQKLIVTGVLDGAVLTSSEVHALTLTGLFAV